VASRDEARTDTAAAGDMLGPAWSLRWRAPEVALLFAERAGAVAKLAGDGPDRLRAEATVVVASCRVGQQLSVVERGIAAVRLAERQSDTATMAMLRVELAGCARTAGVPLVGAAVLRPVLTSDAVRPSVRADALVQMVGCLAQLADAAVLDEALGEADRLYAEDRDIDSDSRVVLRALLRSVASGEQRRRGDARAAVDAAQEGADLLGSLNRPSADNGEVGARVALRLVHGLLDLGRMDEAATIAGTELARPVRAPAATAVGWLGLAMAVRKHLAAGAPAPALALLRDAAELAERHRLSSLRAEALTTLSDAHERVGQLADALDCLRTAQGVRLRWARAVYAARTKLVGAFGETTSPEEFVQLLGGAGASGGRRAAEGREGEPGREHAAALLGRFGMRRPISADVTPAAPNTDVTMVLVDLTATGVGAAASAGPIGEQVLSQVLDRVRDAAPNEAQVARVGGAEFAVLLPSTQTGQTGQTERWVERFRGAIADVDWASLTPGIAVNVRVAVAQQSGRRAAKPVFATAGAATTGTAAAAGPVQAQVSGPTTGSVFELPTVPLMPLGIGSNRPQSLVERSAGQLPTSPAETPARPGTDRSEATHPRIARPTVGRPGAAHSAAGQSDPRLVGQPVPGGPPAQQSPATTGSHAVASPAAYASPSTTGSHAVPGSQGAGSYAPPSSPSTTGSHAVPAAAGPTVAGPYASPSSPATTGSHAVPAAPAAQNSPTAPAVPGSPAEQGARPYSSAPPPILPALPIPPPLEPAHPVSDSPVFQQSARSGQVPMSSDPSVRISAADISAAGATPDAEPPMSWPAEPGPTPIDQTPPPADDPYRSPFADSPFADPMGDPNEPSRPRHSVDAEAGSSVLSNLGITSGSATRGGRRRAKEDQEPNQDQEPAAEQEPAPRIVSFDDFGHLEPLPQAEPEPEPAAEHRRPALGEPMATDPFGDWAPLRSQLPTPPAPVQPAPVPQLPAQHSPIQSQPIHVPPPAEPETQQDKQQDRQQDNPSLRTGGKRRRSVQLADLLTEAMMAYQDAQDSNDGKQNPLGPDPSASLPGPTSLPGPLAGPVGLDPAVGDELGYPGPARHGGDTQRGDARWLTTRWDPDERS
jgi:hypothetical protein